MLGLLRRQRARSAELKTAVVLGCLLEPCSFAAFQRVPGRVGSVQHGPTSQPGTTTCQAGPGTVELEPAKVRVPCAARGLPGLAVHAAARRPPHPLACSSLGAPSGPLEADLPPAMSERLDLGAIPGLVQRLRSGRSVEQLQVARALMVIVMSTSSARRATAEAGALPILMRLASSESGPVMLPKGRCKTTKLKKLRVGAVSLLAQMIHDQDDLIEAFVAAGGVALMLRLLVHGAAEQLQLAGAILAATVMHDASYGWCTPAGMSGCSGGVGGGWAASPSCCS